MPLRQIITRAWVDNIAPIVCAVGFCKVLFDASFDDVIMAILTYFNVAATITNYLISVMLLLSSLAFCKTISWNFNISDIFHNSNASDNAAYSVAI